MTRDTLLTMEKCWLILHYATHERAEGEPCRLCDCAYRAIMPPEVVDEFPDAARVPPLYMPQEALDDLALRVTGAMVRVGGERALWSLIKLLDTHGETKAVSLFIEPVGEK